MKKCMQTGFFLLVALALVWAWGCPPATAAEAITLKYATMNAPTSIHHNEFYVKWAEKVEKLTEGRVKIQIYPGQTLGKATSFFDLVKTGVADIALGVAAYNPGQFPLTEMMTLPMIPINNSKVGSATLWELYEKFPEMRKEYEGTHFLHFGCAAPYFLATAKKPVRTLEDLKGLQVRTFSARSAEGITKLGAVPVDIAISELYVAMEKGVVDTVTTVFEAMSQLPVDKLKYATIVDLYSSPFWIAANPRSWAKISPADQEIIAKECAGMAGSLMEGAAFDNAEAPMRALAKNWEWYTLPKEEAARWEALVKPIHAEYIAQMAKRNLPAQKFYDEMLTILKRNNETYK